MEVYIVFTLLLFCFAFYEIFSRNIKTKRFLLFLSFLGAVFIVGLRWETGTDWEMYRYIYGDSENLRSVLLYWRTEIGYGIFSWLVRNLAENYTFFLLIHSILFYGLLLRAFVKLTKYPQVAFLFYFASTLGIMGSNRQLIALVIILNGIVFLLNEKRKNFLFSIVLAFTFHATSVLGGVYYFLNRYISKFWILLIVLVAFVLGISPLPLKLFGALGGLGTHFMTKTDAYLETASKVASEYSLTIAGAFKRMFFFFFFFFIRDKVVVKMPSYNILFNGYWIGILLYLIFHSSLTVMVSRGSLYFNVMEALLLSSFIVIIKKPIDKLMYIILLFIIGIFLMYQSIGEYPELFDPYKGLWYNENYYRRGL